MQLRRVEAGDADAQIAGTEQRVTVEGEPALAAAEAPPEAPGPLAGRRTGQEIERRPARRRRPIAEPPVAESLGDEDQDPDRAPARDRMSVFATHVPP